jgi:hypothetical protein
MEQGRLEDARRAADELIAYQAPQFDKMPMMIDYYLPNPFFVMLRFQKWDEILKTPAPDEKKFMTRALWHYARALALAGKGQQNEAVVEKQKLSDAGGAYLSTGC